MKQMKEYFVWGSNFPQSPYQCPWQLCSLASQHHTVPVAASTAPPVRFIWSIRVEWNGTITDLGEDCKYMYKDLVNHAAAKADFLIIMKILIYDLI